MKRRKLIAKSCEESIDKLSIVGYNNLRKLVKFENLKGLNNEY